MRELTIDEMAEIRGGDSCTAANIIAGAFGVVSFGFGATAFLMTGGAATPILLLGAGSFSTGLSAAGTFIGSALAGCIGGS